jgi:putative SOS response-associated peptidase YedK
VVTTGALGELARVHDRMPLVLPPQRWAAWLGGAGADGQAEELLAAPPEEFLAGLEIRPVGPAVGDVRNDGPSLITRVGDGLTDKPITDLGVAVEPVNLTLF